MRMKALSPGADGLLPVCCMSIKSQQSSAVMRPSRMETGCHTRHVTPSLMISLASR